MPFIISSNRVLLAHALSMIQPPVGLVGPRSQEQRHETAHTHGRGGERMPRPEHVAAILVIEARLNKMDACIEARLEKMDARIVILQKSIDDLAVGLHDLGNDVDAM